MITKLETKTFEDIQAQNEKNSINKSIIYYFPITEDDFYQICEIISFKV
jgi:hypothetical protein